MAKKLAGRDLKIYMIVHTAPMYLHTKFYVNRPKGEGDRAISC